jgi:hypothetical protein
MNVYAYTVYVKQRAERQYCMLRICPGIAGQRDSRSGGQLGYKKCPLFSLSSLVKMVGKTTIWLELYFI